MFVPVCFTETTRLINVTFSNTETYLEKNVYLCNPSIKVACEGNMLRGHIIQVTDFSHFSDVLINYEKIFLLFVIEH